MSSVKPVERSFAEVVQDAIRNIQEIVRSEITLAKAELREEADKTLSAIVWLSAGAVCALLAVLYLSLALMYGLGLTMPLWAAALVVAGFAGTTASALLLPGVRRFQKIHPTPERTVRTMKENVKWLKPSNK
jgi:hypothetical protein